MGNHDGRLLYVCADRGIPVGGLKGSSIHIREFLTALRVTRWDAEVLALRSECNTDEYLGYRLHVPTEQEQPFFEELLQRAASREAARELRSFYDNHRIELHGDACLEVHRFDLVYERYSLFGMAGLTLARRNGLPFVLEVNAPLVEEATEHRGLVHATLARDIEGFLFSNADCVLAVSDELKRHVQRIAPATRVEVVANGVNPDRFPESVVTNAVSTRVRREHGDFVIGFLGTIRPWHGLNIFLEAIPRILAADRSFRVCIAGEGGEVADELVAWCQKAGVADRIDFTGPVSFDDVPNVLSAMDVLVAPYPPMECFYFSPLKVFEYMAAGKPIVASDIGQLTELIDDDVTGLLVPPGDVDRLAQALLRLRNDVELCRRLGRAARADALRNHTWADRMGRTVDIFATLVNVPAGKGLSYAH